MYLRMSSQSSSAAASMQGSNSPSVPNGKGSAVPPTVTHQPAPVELKNMGSGSQGVKGSIPLGEDIMQLARIGEVPAMQKLFETKKLSATYKDEEGITPLHVCTQSSPPPPRQLKYILTYYDFLHL